MSSSSRQPNPLDAWLDFITSLYPDALTTTYCVPPLHLNRVPYRVELVTGTSETALIVDSIAKKASSSNAPSSSHGLTTPQVMYPKLSQDATTQRPQESDLRDDFCQNHVVTNLQALGKKQQEPMFILSQFKFGHYLNKSTYSAAAAQLPLPRDLDHGQTKYSDGETDILAFHRRYGVLIGELKSVGRWHSMSKTAIQDSDVAKGINSAVTQMIRSEKVVRHLVRDIASDLTVRTSLFLPYVSSDILKRVLTSQPQLFKSIAQCLGASSQTEVVGLCVCADQLSAPDTFWDVSDDVLSKLSAWWRRRMATDDKLLCGPGGDKLYLSIVARFVGPASTVNVHFPLPPQVEVRTAGQAVAELGHRLSRLVLTRQQLDLLTRDPPMVYLQGPPGTGKTVLLVLQGLRWLRMGHDVHVISLRLGSLSASIMIAHQLRVTMDAERSKFPQSAAVYLHSYDFSDTPGSVHEAVQHLRVAVNKGPLRAIMDELKLDSPCKRPLQPLVEELQRLHAGGEMIDFRCWGAGLCNNDEVWCLEVTKITTPLRYAATLQRELASVLKGVSDVTPYSDSELPAPGDGPATITLLHSGEGHTGQWPVDCEACGREVAATLKQLGVGRDGDSSLAWRDVFVITRSPQVKDDEKDAQGTVTSPACGVVRGLRSAGVPVCVISQRALRRDLRACEALLADVATARTDHVTVAESGRLQGLERRVVVWLAGWREGFDDRHSDKVETLDMVYIASRCTTQLIKVDVPRTIKTRESGEHVIQLQNLDAQFVLAVNRETPLLHSATPRPANSVAGTAVSSEGQVKSTTRQEKADGCPPKLPLAAGTGLASGDSGQPITSKQGSHNAAGNDSHRIGSKVKRSIETDLNQQGYKRPRKADNQ